MQKKYVNITIVCFIIGFMLFVQYNTVQNPTIRETRNIWEIRNDLSEELKTHSALLNEIREVNQKISEYESENDKDPEEILTETLQTLQSEAGEAEVSGPGFIMEIKPSLEAIQLGYEIKPVSPLLLTRLVNELNRNKAKYIEIDGQRLTLWSAIRDINGSTTVNGRPISKSNMELKVIGENFEETKRIYNYMLSSSLVDEFYIDNLTIDVQAIDRSLTIQATEDDITSAHLQIYE
jgi:uncharacterized protein YlxW (UPF0749 family)